MKVTSIIIIILISFNSCATKKITKADYRYSITEKPDVIIPDKTTPLTKLPVAKKPLKMTELHKASKKGDIKSVKSLLRKKGIDINYRDNDGMTPLHYAVEWNNYSVVELLLKNGADVNAKNCYGATPVFFVSNARILNTLIKYKADLKIKDWWGETALFWATEKGRLSIVKIMVNNGTGINEQNIEGETPLHHAVHYSVGYSHINIIKFLIKKGANVNFKNAYGWTPLHWAVEKGKLKIAKLLVKNGADVNSETTKDNRKFNITAGSIPLHIAVKGFQGNFKMIDFLIKNGSDIKIKDKNGRNPYDLARYESQLPDSEWHGTARFKRKKRLGLKKLAEKLERKAVKVGESK